MSLSLTVAKRYLLGKKSTNAINVISGISILAMAIGVAALLLILSVFNGFEGLLSGLFNSYKPDLKVTPMEGLYIEADSNQMQELIALADVKTISRIIEEVALFEYKGVQEAGTIKGVDQNYQEVVTIDSVMQRGTFDIADGRLDLGVLGRGMFTKLSINPSDKSTPVTVYMPSGKKRGPLDKGYKALEFYPTGVFNSGTEDDSQLVIASYGFVNRLLGAKAKTSTIEIKLSEGANIKDAVQEIRNVLQDKVHIKDRYQQDEAYLKILRLEKVIAYLIAAFTLILISFNLVGTLWMIVLDKKKDIAVLKSMGMIEEHVQGIFVRIGLLIGSIGFVIGVILTLVIYYLQKKYSIIGVPDGFSMIGYPIELRWLDFVVVAITVFVISYLASLLPSFKARGIGSIITQD